jgi:hypothetical protein
VDKADNVSVAATGYVLIANNTFQSLGSSHDDHGNHAAETLGEHREESRSEGFWDSRCIFGVVLEVLHDNLEKGLLGNWMDGTASKAVESVGIEVRTSTSAIYLFLAPSWDSKFRSSGAEPREVELPHP